MKLLRSKNIKSKDSTHSPFFQNERINTSTGDKELPFFANTYPIIQKQSNQPKDAGDQDLSGVLTPATVPLPTFDFNNKYQEFGRFDANYTPVGPVPAEGNFEISLWVHINFENFSAKRRNKDPYKNFKFTKEQLDDFNWTQEEKNKFESDFMFSVQNAWTNKFKFHLKDPAFAEYVSKVQVTVITVDDPKLAHTKINALKVPKGAPRFRSFVKGSDATLDIRDPSEAEKKKVTAHDMVRQIGPFGFDSSAITPEITDQIKEVADFLKTDPDPDKWSLSFDGRASSEGSASYNEKLGGKRAEAVRIELNRLVGWGDPGNYIGLASGKRNATKEGKFRRVDVTAHKGTPVEKEVDQNVAAHEAGHMFGLGDEYVEEKPKDQDMLPKFLGDKPPLYDSVEKLMGKEAANEMLVQSSESIMGSGMVVKKGHYITFLYALNQMTGKTWNIE